MSFFSKAYKKMQHRFAIMGELFGFFWEQKLFWIIPLVVILLVFAGLMLFAQSTPLAPFIYTAF